MGASCCAQQVTEEQELENKYKHDPSKQPIKGAFKKSNDEKKIVKFPTRIKQEDDLKNEEEVDNPLNEESVIADAKSQKSHKSHKSQNTKRGLFSKQVSQFVKCDDE